MEKNRIIHSHSFFLKAGFMFSCSESNLGTGSNNDPIATETVPAVAAKKSYLASE